jgi:S-adenosylmethionine-diacylglycerol 3-amino-3-carboxypropyl transferase
MKNLIQKLFYDYLFNKKIVYNACMEDPRTDMLLLDPNPGSNIFMLGSGGCNALHYALNSNFESILCIDANPCQVALINIKKQVIENGTFEDLWKMFGDGIHENIKIPYEKYYRPGLDPNSTIFWDKNLKNFQKNGSNQGFHFHTGCGFITRCFSLLKEEQLKQIAKIFELDNKKQQMLLYEKYLEPVFNNLFTRIIISLTTHFGIPSRQIGMINTNPSEVLNFLNKRIKTTLTELPANENYFYHVYIFGHYKRGNAPEYLKESNFLLLKENHRKIKVENAYIGDYLNNSHERYSHFALLDHLDWLVHDPGLLELQWRAILSRSKSGTKLLIRSYFNGFEWMPDFVKKHIDIDTDIEKHIATDRLGIYNKTYLLHVKMPFIS